MTFTTTETPEKMQDTWVRYTPEKKDQPGLKLIELSFPEQVERIIKPAPPDHAIHWQIAMIFDQYGKDLERREQIASHSRLSGLRVHGMKLHPGQDRNTIPINRFQHSRIVAAYALVFALCAGRTIKHALEACEAGWRHDANHPPYCHQTEYAITQAPYHIDTHEERSLRTTLNDRDLLHLVLNRDLDLANIVDAMRERGSFLTQSPADTTGYTEHDSFFMGDQPVPEDYGWQIASSILGGKSGRLVVNDPEPLQGLLERRALYHQICYSSLHGRLLDAIIGKVLRYAFAQKLFTPEDVMNETDDFVDSFFLRMMSGDIPVPDWMMSLLTIAHGDVNEIDKWDRLEFTEAGKYEAEKRKLTSWRKDVVAVPVRNFMDKRIRIVSTSGIERELQANIPLNKVDRTNFLFMFKR